VVHPDSEPVKAQWKVKESFGLEADLKTRTLLTAALPSGPGTSQRGQIDIFNTCSWPRTDVVILSKEQSSGGDRILDSAGHAIASQRLASGELVFLAKDVPPLGATRYRIAAGAASPPSAAVRVEGNSIRSAEFDLTVDPSTGAIRSLRAARLGRELVDAHAQTALNDYFYLPGENLNDLKRNGPVKIRVQEAGPLVASLVVESEAPGLKQLVREIRVISGLDRVELINTLDKLAVRTKEGIHFGFGFDVPAGVLRYDVPFGVVRPNEDQLDGSCKNWLAVQRWVDISNPDYGVTWATLDAPLIEIGAITANLLGPVEKLSRWIQKLPPSQTLYSWALNNHWHTNFRADQEGLITFRYALHAHGAYDPAVATRFGMAYSQPLLAAPASGRNPLASRLRMRNERIVVAGLKPSDDGQGHILRLFNVSGEATTASLEWASPVPSKMWLSNLSEKKVKPLAGNLELSPWEFITLRVE
jgi:alpha-mannosidase